MLKTLGGSGTHCDVTDKNNCVGFEGLPYIITCITTILLDAIL